MRSSLLRESCELEFERCVAEIYAAKFDCCGQAGVDVPWSPGWGFTKAGIPHLIRDVRAALDAKIWFAEYGPDWAKPLPMGRERSALLRAHGALHVLGLYANSLERLDFDYHTHPQLFEFACGVMADPHAPDHVRYDPELQNEFPAKELPGLGDRFIWSNEHLHAGRLMGA
jgi:hypothetical protein